MTNLIERLKWRFFGDDRSVTWEGSSGMLRLAGDPPVERLIDDTVRLCKGAIDRSTRSLVDRERLQPAANRIDLHAVVAGHGRAVALQDAVDGMDLHEELSEALTDYAVNQQQFLVWGGRIAVTPLCVEERAEGEGDEIRIRWRRDKTTPPFSPAPSSPTGRTSREERARANRPADPSVFQSGRKTVHSGEGISQPFTLWVRDRGGEANAHLVMTPFYFGRATHGVQIEIGMEGEELISGEHFSILYLPELGYVLRDNKSTNGTMVIRGDEAVRLSTSTRRRDIELAKEMRLKDGDIVRLERGKLSHRSVLQMAFVRDGVGVEAMEWADDLEARGIHWREAREIVVRRLLEGDAAGGPMEEYTLMIGESFLGESVTGALWVAYEQKDENFREGEALARVEYLSRCTLTWLRGEIPAALNDRPLPAGETVGVPSQAVLSFRSSLSPASPEGDGEPAAIGSSSSPNAPVTRVRFNQVHESG